MHSAFYCSKVLDTNQMRAKWKVTCVESWGADRVLIGCSEGGLRILERPDNPKDDAWKEVEVCENFSRRSVDQLCVVRHQNQVLLLSLSEGFITLHSLPQLQPRCKIDKSKGCVLFALNKKEFAGAPSDDSALLLCVAKKKGLSIFKWDGDNTFIHYTDLQLLDTPRSLEWAGKSVCVGLRKDYALVNVDTGVQKEIFPVGRKSIPVSTLLPGAELLLGRDLKGICVGLDGQPTRQEGLDWSDVPVGLLYSHPYVLALLPNGLEVRNMLYGTLTQTLVLKGAKYCGGGQLLVVASSSAVLCLKPASLIDQIQSLVKQSLFKEAIAFVDNSLDSEWASEALREKKLNELNTLLSYHLFNTGNFHEAMRYFHQTDCDPRQILALFPDVLPSGQFADVKHPVPVRRIQGEASLKLALSALTPYLANLRGRLTLTDENAKPRELQGRVSALVKVDKQDAGQEKFTSSSSERQMPLAVLVDTVLLKAYLLMDDNGTMRKKPRSSNRQQSYTPEDDDEEQLNLVSNFLQQGTRCDIEESQTMLRAYQKHSALVCLYKTRGCHREALTLLAALGQSRERSRLQGTKHTIRYLTELADSPDPRHATLVFEFSKWALRLAPDEALTIFTTALSSENTAKNLPPNLVLDHLKKVSDRQQCIRYLEALIETGETRARFHNEVIFLYLEAVRAEMKRVKELQRTLGTSDKAVKKISEGEACVRDVRRTLLAFLQSSTHYTPQKMLSTFPRDELLEERAILLSRIDHHEQALMLYAHKLKDPKKAEDYCRQYYNEHSPDTKNMYLNLLKVYLTPPPDLQPPPPPNVDACVALLIKYHERIDAAAALSLLPDDTPTRKVMPFLTAVLSQNKHVLRNSQIVRNLLFASKLKVRTTLVGVQRERIVIDRDTICPGCGKRIGNTVFARSPSNVIMHYSCSSKQNKGKSKLPPT